MSKVAKARIKPDYIRRVYVPKYLLRKTGSYLKFHGLQGNEGMVFWSGCLLHKHDAWIRHCIYPRQKTTPVSVEINLDEIQKINIMLCAQKEFLFAQVHSHPGQAFHSSIDDNYPITFKPGFFSIVIPFFCKKHLRFLKYKIWEYKGFGKWHKLGPEEVKARFIISREESEIKNESIT